MRRYTMLMVLAIAISWANQAWSYFWAGETVIAKRGSWVCYHPEYFVDSARVLEKTDDLGEMRRVLEQTDDCTRLPATAPFKVRQQVGSLYVSSSYYPDRMRWYILQVGFTETSPDIYIMVPDPREKET